MTKEAILANNQIFFETLELISAKRKKFTGIVTPYKRLKETSLEALDLPVRAYHCLKRANCETIGDVLERYPTKSAVLKIRNCGNQSANDIFIHIMAYQFEILSDKEKIDYLRRLLEINGLEVK